MAERLSRRALWMHKLAGEVVNGITRRVRSGALAPGAALGSREEIAGSSVTSLAVVDRALDMLAAQNLIERAADGTWHVAAVPPPAATGTFEVAAAADLDDVVHILELRLGVETVSAALAAERRTDADLEAIGAAARAHEEAVASGGAAGRADFCFHRAIAAASDNRYLLDLVEYLGPLLIPRMRNGLALSDGGEAGESLQHSLAEHRLIVTAIEAGDAEAARDAMGAHLNRTIAFVRSIETAANDV